MVKVIRFSLKIINHAVISRDLVLVKRCGNVPKKLAISKQLQTQFKAKHEKRIYPRVLSCICVFFVTAMMFEA